MRENGGGPAGGLRLPSRRVGIGPRWSRERGEPVASGPSRQLAGPGVERGPWLPAGVPVRGAALVFFLPRRQVTGDR